MENNLIFSLISLFAITSVAMASSGSFGEMSGPLVYNAFVSSAQTRTWILINNYNFSLGFYITKPNLSDISISTSVTNGIIKANSNFQINVTVLSNTNETTSGYITAYAVPNGTNSTGAGASIQLAAIKSIEVKGINVSVSKQTQPLQNSSANSSKNTGTTNKVQGQGIQGATSTILQSTHNEKLVRQATGGLAVMSISTVVPYLIVAIVLLLVVVFALLYRMSRKNRRWGN